MDDGGQGRTNGARGIAARLAAQVSGLLFPPQCAGCGREVADPGTVCGRCWSHLRFIDRPYCAVMGTPFAHDLGENFLSAEAIADPPPFRRARAAVIHDGIPRRMIVGLKYHDQTNLAPWMAKWMVRAGGEMIADCDVIVPVPLHPLRFWSRRFNQAAELARAVARISEKPLEPEALIRVKRTRQQVGLLATERQRNVSGAFRVPQGEEIKVRGRNILLVDDVYTTGATVKAATRALMRARAASVDVLTFSRVLPDM
ncbi:amidophosphoribosyltransferase [Paramesorhizobium deserti]|uniref:Amidophosphoribosyltransferase n=1 Tax=Paramesorhizobium deserti TaxID=1494590 RepID=A0A135I1U1_9HYPH|nr:ComF family protein [Paramesorhizobium deserti]KXF79388.1 amidophosphoribosyltransferase [Paramesorhizobium deserti]